MTATTRGLAFELAVWSEGFATAPMSPVSARQIRMILLDALACALAAAETPKIAAMMRLADDLGGAPDCTIIGSRRRTALPSAALMNGILIRALDWNDRYNGPRQTGHPSDNLGAAIAAAEIADRSGLDLMRAVRLGYEIYGRMLDLSDPDSPWDHVSVSGMATAAMVGWLLRLGPAELGNAIALAATHSATLGEVRAGKVSGAKSIANAIVAHTATLLTLFAGQGVTGPETAIEGSRGFAPLLLDGAADRFFHLDGPDRTLSVGFKQYPCFALGQAPVDAGIEVHGQGRIDAIAHIRIRVSNTPQARNRVGAGHREIMSSEQADHDLGVLVAMAILDGVLTPAQFEDERWRDAEVRALASRVELTIDDTLEPARSLPCRMDVMFADGSTRSLARDGAPGSSQNPIEPATIEEKFRICASGKIDRARIEETVASVAGLDEMGSIRDFMAGLGLPHGG